MKITSAVCTEFAVSLLEALAEYNLARIVSMFDEVDGDVPVAAQFPEPQGFRYCSSVDAESLVFHFIERNDGSFEFDFEMPFEDEDFRPMMIRTIFKGSAESHTVTLEGVTLT